MWGKKIKRYKIICRKWSSQARIGDQIMLRVKLPRGSNNLVKIARADFHRLDRTIEISGDILARTPGNNWRIGLTPDGKIVIIDAGQEKIIAAPRYYYLNEKGMYIVPTWEKWEWE